MPRINVDPEEKYPRPYWPQELKNEGFVGNMLVLNDALTATIIHPRASLDQVKRSLEIVLKDVKLRMEKEQQIKGEQDNKDKLLLQEKEV